MPTVMKSRGELQRQCILIRDTARRFCVSMALWFRRLRPTLAWFEVAPCSPLDASEKAIVSELAANALGGAHRPEQIRFRLDGQ
jgi:hypothetical protein